MNRRTLNLVALLFAAGCSTYSSERNICDGTKDLRFRFYRFSPPAQILSGDQVLFDNGTPYLFIDGQCAFSASDYSSIWSDVHAGTLTEKQATAIAGTLHYDRWPSLKGNWDGSAAADASWQVFSDGMNQFSCYFDCADPSNPRDIIDIGMQWMGAVESAYSAGEPINGPQRIMVVRYDQGAAPGGSTTQWDLTLPIESVALSESQAAVAVYGDGVLVSDPDDAGKLRKMRRTYAASGDLSEPLVVVDGSNKYRVAIRDAIPGESSSGLVPVTDTN